MINCTPNAVIPSSGASTFDAVAERYQYEPSESEDQQKCEETQLMMKRALLLMKE
ncbi:MAG: hypothetical protein ACH349_05375 [Candidatus Rhabdochlamydia sp.]|jgi:hypothetical protein|nr:hypothetical protein [Chlamydiota bacterium]